MNAFVAAGFAVMTFSVRGYAKSELNHNAFGVQTEQAIEDLGAVMDWLRAQGVQKRDLLGWSWGGRITGRYVEDHADRVGRLLMLDPALTRAGCALEARTRPKR